MPAHTLMLDSSWDLTLDGNGGIRITTGSYAIAQEVATKIRAFYNDMYYKWNKGIPHYANELGAHPNFTLIRSRYKRRALEVDGVADAEVELDESAILSADSARTLTGDILLTMDSGETAEIEI